MDKLAIMSEPAVAHVNFGIFNLAWPDIAFWILVIAIFVVAAWARIPQFMESDAASRQTGENQ